MSTWLCQWIFSFSVISIPIYILTNNREKDNFVENLFPLFVVILLPSWNVKVLYSEKSALIFYHHYHHATLLVFGWCCKKWWKRETTKFPFSLRQFLLHMHQYIGFCHRIASYHVTSYKPWHQTESPNKKESSAKSIGWSFSEDKYLL